MSDCADEREEEINIRPEPTPKTKDTAVPFQDFPRLRIKELEVFENGSEHRVVRLDVVAANWTDVYHAVTLRSQTKAVGALVRPITAGFGLRL